jgi:hypothetical protein
MKLGSVDSLGRWLDDDLDELEVLPADQVTRAIARQGLDRRTVAGAVVPVVVSMHRDRPLAGGLVARGREVGLDAARDFAGQDLSRTDLSAQPLAGADLRATDLSAADLRRAQLPGADLSDARCAGADFAAADLSGANLSRSDMTGADLSGARLAGATVTGADFTGASLAGADLTGVAMHEAGAQSVPSLDAPPDQLRSRMTKLLDTWWGGLARRSPAGHPVARAFSAWRRGDAGEASRVLAEARADAGPTAVLLVACVAALAGDPAAGAGALVARPLAPDLAGTPIAASLAALVHALAGDRAAADQLISRGSGRSN